jgi:hypothetical protein
MEGEARVTTRAMHRYREMALALEELQQLAFACGCIEHVLPLYEATYGSGSLRKATDYAWQEVLGSASSRVTVDALVNEVKAATPHLDFDDRPEAEMGMRIGVAVLEALDGMAGDTEVAYKVGTSVIDSLSHAIYRFQGKETWDWAERLDEPDAAMPVIADEWAAHMQMLEEVRSWVDGRNAFTWREEQRSRGRQIAQGFGL